MTTTMAISKGNMADVVSDLSKSMVADWLAFNVDKAVATVKTYSKAVGHFMKWLADNDIVNPTRQDVINYRDYLCTSKKISTTRLYMTAVKTFSRWLASEGKYVDFTAGVRTPRLDEAAETHAREALTLDEAKSVLNSFKGSDVKTLRDKLILRLALNCGLRSCEIVRLDVGDIERRHGKNFLKVWGKGRHSKTARVEISKSIYDMILDYLQARGSKRQAGEPLFVSLSNRCRGERIQTQTVSKLAKQTFRSVGIDSPTIVMHSCRHFCITQMLLEGVDIEAVRQIARHKSGSTTQVYRHDINAANNPGISILSKILDNKEDFYGKAC